MPENNKIKSDEIRVIARGQAVVEARQMLDSDGKILSITANADVRPSEVFAGEARYAGKVRFDCLMLNDGKVECVSAVADFSDKITSPDIAAGITPVITFEITNCEATVDGGSLKLVAVIDTELTGAMRSECECIAEPEQGIYAEKCELKYSEVTAEQSELFYLTDALQNVKARDVLSTSSTVVITGAECTVDEVKISGAVYTNIVARADDGLACAYKLVTPLVKGVAVRGAMPDSTALITACVTENTATLVADPSGDRIDVALTVKADITMVAQGTAYAATDVFCSDNELNVTTADVRICAIEQQVTVIDTVDGQISLDADRLAADNVLCITNTFCQISSAKVENGRVSADGLVGGDITYYNAENNKIDSIAFRLPFSMPLTVNTTADNVMLRATVTDVTVKIRRESVFDVKAEVAFTARPYSCSNERVVCSVTRGEPIPRPDATFIVHITKPGETLWQAAKVLCCSPDRVIEQNSATAPYSGGERLVNFCTK